MFYVIYKLILNNKQMEFGLLFLCNIIYKYKQFLNSVIKAIFLLLSDMQYR
jgi:hypothetical protein